jgi:hypothetical protein
VPLDDRVDIMQPLLGGREVVGGVAACASGLRRQPSGEAAAGRLRVDVRARASDDVDADLGGDVEQPVDVAHAGEVVDARGRRVVAPVEVDRHRVVAVGLHLPQHVTPQVPTGMHVRRPSIMSEYLSNVTVWCRGSAAGVATARRTDESSDQQQCGRRTVSRYLIGAASSATGRLIASVKICWITSDAAWA